MRVYCQKSLFLIFSLLVFVAKAQDSTSNDLPYPIEDRTGDFLTDPSNNPFDFDDPDAIEQHVEYDAETDRYVITETLNGKNIKHLTNHAIQNEENLCQSVDRFVIEYSRYNLFHFYRGEEIQVM